MNNIIRYIKDNNNKLFFPMMIGIIFIGSLFCGFAQYFSDMWHATHMWYYQIGECFFVCNTLLILLSAIGYCLYSLINFLEGLR